MDVSINNFAEKSKLEEESELIDEGKSWLIGRQN
jgi:hypothetical protein